jgi:GNAT superfamily N-acetyltransferase
MSANLHKAARCFGLFVEGTLAAFIGVLPISISTGENKGQVIWRVSRVVVLPDFQGLGIAFRFLNTIGAAYKRMSRRFRMYPAHPFFTKMFFKDTTNWVCISKMGFKTTPTRHKGTLENKNKKVFALGGKFNAVFEYVGPTMIDFEAARHLVFDRLQ